MFFGNTSCQRFGSDRRGTNGIRVENCPGISPLGILDEIQKMVTESKCEPQQFKGRIIFMSMYNDIDWRRRGNRKYCIANSVKITGYARGFPQGRWSFLGSGFEKKWYETHTHKRDGERDKNPEGMMMLNFAESGHPVSRATSALEREELRSTGKGKKSIHFNGSEENIELILRTVISVNHLSVYGAELDLCEELARDSEGTGKPGATGNLESTVIPTEFPTADPIAQTNAQVRGNLLREYEQTSAELHEPQELTKLCSDASVLKNIGKVQFFITFDEEGPGDMKGSCREYTLPRSEWKHEDRPSLGCEGLSSSRTLLC